MKIARSIDSSGASAATDAAAAGLQFISNGVANADFAATMGDSTTGAAVEQQFKPVIAAAAAENIAASQAGDYQRRVDDELAKQNFDAFVVTFNVSSPRALASPFVVVAIDFRRREVHAGPLFTAVTVRPLPAIHTEPHKVSFVQGGLPIGYTLEDLRVHLFDGGAEVGTTISPMRSELSADEAFEYRVIDYVSAHPDATLPATVADGEVSEALRHHLRTHYGGQPVHVRVLPTGRALRAFRDPACTQPIEDDAGLGELLARVRFNPALAKGRPVRGVATLRAEG
jgi:hypothetical protein